MSEKSHSKADKVRNFLKEKGFEFEIKELTGSTRTAQEAADCVGCSIAQIAKSLIFKNKKTGKPVLVIASGSNRVDVKKVEKSLGLKLGRADGNYVKQNVGFAIGGVPPVGHATPLETILDPDLKKYKEIWAAAGTPHALFQLSPEDLAPLTGGTWLELAEE